MTLATSKNHPSLLASPREDVALASRRMRLPWLACLVGFALFGCEKEQTVDEEPKELIRIGAALPFSGPRASTGIHLERALMLAVEDVNRAGGVNGKQLSLKVRDSNSGSSRGRDEIIKLFDVDDISYLVGPEEDHLALSMVGEVKRRDVMQLLPSITSPSITDSGTKGAWVRLVPSTLTMGCALATKANADGITTTRTIAERDDYHLELATVFSSAFSSLGGRAHPTVSVASDESSYKRAIAQVNRYTSDATLMLAYPGTAATIIKEMSRGDEVRWYLSPMLRDDALLWNLPEGVVENSVGVSPSLSSNAECDLDQASGGVGGVDPSTHCEADAADRFAKYYEDRWGTAPLLTAHFYYDAVIMLALGLEGAASDGHDDPSPQQLLPYITTHSEDDDRVAWDSLDEGLDLAGDGRPIHYVGAAGEYEFNRRGQNIRTLVDTWVITDGHQFAQRESVICSLAIGKN